MLTNAMTPATTQRSIFNPIAKEHALHSDREPTRRRARRSAKRWIVLMLLLLLAIFGLEVYRVTAGPNWHVVVPDQVFRSAQLTETELTEAIDRFGLKSVINLRGECPETDWYQWEQSTLQRCGVAMYNVNLSTYEPPSPIELNKLTDYLMNCPKPVLIHCRRGSDRTSLATAVAQILLSETTIANAKKQLSLRFGHMPFGKVQFLDEAFEDYNDWLAQKSWQHDPSHWVQFIRADYRPGPYWALIEPLEVPKQLQVGQWGQARFRVHNRSHRPWHFRQAAHVGIHLHYYLKRQSDQTFTAGGGAGYFDHVVPPGGSLELNLAIAPQRQAGTYDFFVDLADAQVCYFFMVDSPPFQTTVKVVP